MKIFVVRFNKLLAVEKNCVPPSLQRYCWIMFISSKHIANIGVNLFFSVKYVYKRNIPKCYGLFKRNGYMVNNLVLHHTMSMFKPFNVYVCTRDIESDRFRLVLIQKHFKTRELLKGTKSRLIVIRINGNHKYTAAQSRR